MWFITVLLILFLTAGFFIGKFYVLDWWHRRTHGHSLMMKPPPATKDWSKKQRDS
jgi:hypothetical protein